jgi:hypothetical protein
MRMVGLSAQQQQQIADGFAVFSHMMEPVLQVRWDDEAQWLLMTLLSS